MGHSVYVAMSAALQQTSYNMLDGTTLLWDCFRTV